MAPVDDPPTSAQRRRSDGPRDTSYCGRTQSGERGGPRVHREYLIERFRVVFESGTQWKCACAEFSALNSCGHTREAAGRRAAQAQIARRLSTGRSQLSPPHPRVDPSKANSDVGKLEGSSTPKGGHSSQALESTLMATREQDEQPMDSSRPEPSRRSWLRSPPKEGAAWLQTNK